MAQLIRRSFACTADKFEENQHRFNFREIEGARVFWDTNGTLAMIAPQEWCDYLCGRNDEPPGEMVKDIFEVSPADLALLFEL